MFVTNPTPRVYRGRPWYYKLLVNKTFKVWSKPKGRSNRRHEGKGKRRKQDEERKDRRQKTTEV